MRRTPRILIAVACALSLATSAHAAGINLSWNDCGTFGQDVETFACNTNLGLHTLVASFVSPVPFDQFLALESSVELQVNQPTLSPWWDFTTSTGCRASQAVMSSDFLSNSNCVDPWFGAAVNGLQFTPNFGQPNRGRFRVIVALPPSSPMPLDDVSQYYAFKILIRNQKTIGTGSCGGCADPGCIVLDYIQLEQSAGVPNYVITQPIDRLNVGWQCPSYPATEGALCFNACPVPTGKPTWGAIKSLYR